MRIQPKKLDRTHRFTGLVMIGLFQSLLYASLTPPAYNPVIQGLFKKQKNIEAMWLFEEMAEKGDSPPDALSYKFVFRGLCSGGGPIMEASNFLVEMLEHGFLPEFSTFYMLADGLGALSMQDTLVKLIDMVMKKARFPDSEVSMVIGFIKIRKYQDALATLGSILNSVNPKTPNKCLEKMSSE